MEKSQIIEVIKANQSLSYTEVKRQADEAGLTNIQFEEAWREAKLDSSLNHDERVDKIKSEMLVLGKESKDIHGWKNYFMDKGYLDDEVDLAYVLSRNQVKFKPNIFLMILYVLMVIVDFYLISLAIKYYGNSELLFQVSIASFFLRDVTDLVYYALLVALAGVVIYTIYLGMQLKSITAKIINFDFNAVPAVKLLEWSGSRLLAYPKAVLSSLFKMEYDGRVTYYGEYSYTIGSGKHKNTYYFSFIAQKAHKDLPLTHCFAPWIDRSLFEKEVQLEGGEFNKAYNIYADKPQDAFYIYNPRVMSAMLEPEVKKDLKSFETIGEYLIMSFTNLTLSTPLRIKKPYVRFSDYQIIKEKMLKRLDLASNLNDTLSRLIVDDGANRSVAKI